MPVFIADIRQAAALFMVNKRENYMLTQTKAEKKGENMKILLREPAKGENMKIPLKESSKGENMKIPMRVN